MRHPIDAYGSAGILTSCPSVTHFCLTLGPTNPGPSCVAQETLGLRSERFSLSFMLLVPTFSLLYRPRVLADPASTVRECSATARPCGQALNFGTQFSPVEFLAQNDLTSELLRFL